MKEIKANISGYFLFVIILGLPIALIPFVSLNLAMSIPITFGVVAIIIGIALVVGYLRLKDDNQDAILYPATDDLPDILVDADIELHLLDFVQIGRFKHNKSSPEQFSYLYDDRTIMAFVITLNEKIYVNICSYLDDGFAINTDFGGTLSTDNEKNVRHIVDSDIETALNYHEHQVSQYIAQHGEPKAFSTLQEILDWEDQYQMTQNTHQDVMKQFKQLGVRLAQAFVFSIILILLTAGIQILLTDPTDTVGESAFLSLLVVLLRYFGYLSSIIWVIQPLSQPETVEQRKKKEFA